MKLVLQGVPTTSLRKEKEEAVSGAEINSEELAGRLIQATYHFQCP